MSLIMRKYFESLHNIKLLVSVLIISLVALKFEDIGSAIPLIGLCAGGGGGCGCGNAGRGATSTPFLCTWNKEKFVFENDFLFGKPTSSFDSVEEGEKAYEAGLIEGDLYKIKNELFLENKKLKFQIKEIEPEESFIDCLSLFHVTYPKEGELVVDSKFKDFFVFKREALEKAEGIESQVVFDNFDKNINNKITTTLNTLDGVEETNVHEMMTDDVLKIKGVVKKEHQTKPLFFLLGSHYRDWTLGEIFDSNSGYKDILKDEVLGAFTQGSRSPLEILRVGAKAVALVVVLSVVWVTGFTQNVFQARTGPSDDADSKRLAVSFGARDALADVPRPPRPPRNRKSLVIEYWNGSIFKEIDVIQPRYYQPNIDAISVPKEAILDNGEVVIQVTATKRHNVSSALLVSPKEYLPYEIEELKPTKVFHKRENLDHTETIEKEGSKQYLHTIPADVVDIEFEQPQQKNVSPLRTEAYLMKSKGFYVPATEASQRTAGNWVEKLDPEAREWLKQMYSLKDYEESDRKPIL